MQSWEYDVAIVGGGPGGSTAAAYARQRNLRVLVLEKERFPRFHIGESLLPMGNALLREIGVWPKLEAAGFVRKYGAAFFLANGRAETEIQFDQSLIPGLDYTFQVERAKFDAILLDHAQELGAEVRCETTVRAVETVDGVHHVRLQSAAGPQTVTARWVLDASGRETLFSLEQKRAFDPSPFPKRVAIYNHFHGVVRAPGRAGGHTVAVRLDHGWFWMIPLDDEKTSVGLVTTVEAMRAAALRPEEFFARAVAGSVKLRELLGDAQPLLPFRVTSDYSYFHRKLAAERVVLVGDAAGFFDPIFSSGVYMSMSSGRLAVDLVARAHAAGRALTPAEQRSYTAAVKRSAGIFQKLIAVFYDNSSFAVFMCPEVRWGIRRAITSIVAGHARFTWGLWWRFQMFLLICRLQRRFRLVPRLEFDGPALDPATATANP
jgi:flavin-dependent dehydrogenase